MTRGTTATPIRYNVVRLTYDSPCLTVKVSNDYVFFCIEFNSDDAGVFSSGSKDECRLPQHCRGGMCILNQR